LEIYGIEGYDQTVYPLWAGFPDAHNTILHMVAEDDRVATLWTATGTHRGEFFGFPPTGRSIEIYGITIERVRGGRRLEGWGSPDMLGLMQQIGAAPGG
jgi:predicted ester cyclase